MADVKVIVAQTVERGHYRARQEGLPLRGPGAVCIISTSSDGRSARGMRLQRDEVIWDEGWSLGRHAEQVALALAPCFVT